MKHPPSLLSNIEARIHEASELRREALALVIDLALGRVQADKEKRIEMASRFQGYEREYWTATQVQLELISNGRTETRFDGGAPSGAVVTPLIAADASSAIRVASRGPSEKPAAENMTPVVVPTPGGPPPANLPAAGEVF